MQNIIPKKVHKSLPTFSLHSTRSFKIFSKNYPKHVHKLDLDCRIGHYLEHDQTKKILMNLIKLTKRSSKFKAIQYINLSEFLNARASQALCVIKTFQSPISWRYLRFLRSENTKRNTRMVEIHK